MAAVQLLIFIQQKEDISRAQFDQYWRNDHAAAFLAIPIVKKHCLKYEQFHDDPTERETTELAFGLPPSTWSGVAVLTFDSADGAKAVFSSPEFVKFATEDEPRFCKFPNVTQRLVMLGERETSYERKA